MGTWRSRWPVVESSKLIWGPAQNVSSGMRDIVDPGDIAFENIPILNTGTSRDRARAVDNRAGTA